MIASRISKVLIGTLLSFSASAFADHNLYHNRTLGVEIVRSEEGLTGTILPDRTIKVLLQCNLFTVSKLIVAEGPGKPVHARPWYPSRSIMPASRPIHFQLSEQAASFMCSNRFHDDYVVSFIGDRAYVSGIDHNQAVVAEAMTTNQE